jgi:GWxTD domain-containing protein
MVLALGVSAPGATSLPQAPDSSELVLSAVRFHRATSTTLVDVFGRVHLRVVSPLSSPGGSGAAYRVVFAVRDSNNLTLMSESWSQGVPAGLLALAGSSTVEHTTFAAQPGRYVVDMTVTDSATGRVTRKSVELMAYRATPAASDLLLASGMRPVSGSDTVAGPGEVRKGSAFLQTSGNEVLTPRKAGLAYYLELYAAHPETVTVSLRVLREDGGQVVALPSNLVPLGVGGGVLQQMLDLSGLPPGRYRLETTIVGPDSTVTRSAAFRMAGFETESAVAAVGTSARTPFSTMTEQQLDDAYDPLIYLMRSDEQGIYSTLSVEGKRQYLKRFWARRDSTPGAGANEAMRVFYSRIGEANLRFREGGASEVPGWRTDRGRIYIRYGEPEEKLRRPQAGSTAPYEVWKYTRGRVLKFVFLDLTRFGNYSLIFTNDRHELSRPDWQALLGPEALTDVDQF